MLKKINNYLFRNRARKYLAETSRKHRFVSYDKAKTVLILFESDMQEKNGNIRQMIAQLKNDGKKVSAWGFVNKKEVMTSILPEYRILHLKQADFSGKPDVSLISELSGLEFDLLIDLSISNVLVPQYLALYANASFKVGTRKSDLTVYDFVLDVDNQLAASTSADAATSTQIKIDENYLFDQIIFYLKHIQTND